MTDLTTYNRQAWDGLVERGNEWTVPVGPEVIRAARRGEWSIVLTPTKPVPREWFPPLAGLPTLCLAGAGGQQGPVLAAAGARVTVYDLSPRQLARDHEVAQRERLELETVEGDMRDLSVFADESFGLIVHPVSNCFVPDVRPVWREAYRVLRPGGVLLAGLINPVAYVFDDEKADRGEIEIRHRLPYSDETSLTDEERQKLIDAGEPFVFSHSLEDLLGAQMEAGFRLTELYEDTWPGKAYSEYLPSFLATRAVR